MNGLDAGLWLGTILSFCVVAFSVIAVIVGATSLRAPAWSWAMQELARLEVHRRVAGRDGDLTQRELIAVARLLDADAADQPPSQDEAQRHWAGIGQLVGPAEHDAAAHLEAESAKWLRWALSLQHRAVRGHVSLAAVSRRWRFRLAWSMCRVSWAGLRWFLPHWLRRVGTLAAPRLAAAATVGAWVGLMAWFLGRHYLFASDPAFPDWSTVVGWWGSLSCAVALFWLSLNQLWLLWRVRQSERPTVSRTRFVLGLSAYVLACSALFIVTGTGLLNEWLSVSAKVGEQIGTQLGQSRILGAAVLIVIAVFGIRNGMGWISNRSLRLGERLQVSAAILVLVMFAFTVVVYGLDGDASLIRATLPAFGFALIGVLAAAGIAEALAFLRRLRELRTAGWPIDRGAFSVWALVAWIVCAAWLAGLEQLVRALLTQGGGMWLGALTLWLCFGFLGLVVTAIPGAFITYSYLRRVNREHARWALWNATRHPAASINGQATPSPHQRPRSHVDDATRP